MTVERPELIQQALQEIQDQPPRVLRLRSLGESPRLWGMSALGAVFAAVMLSLMAYQFIVPALAFYFGTPAPANVVGLWVTHGKGASNNVQVEYFDGAERAAARISISWEAYGQLKTGQTVPIHFLRFFPGAPSLDASPPSFFSFLVFLLFGIVLAAGLNSASKRKSLLAQGKAVKGRIRNPGPKTMVVEFEWEGKTYSVTAPASYYGGRNREDDEAVVLCDPDNPRKNMVYDPAGSYWVPVRF